MELTTDSARRRESRRIMREQKNTSQSTGNVSSDQSPGAGPSTPETKKRKRMDSSSGVSSPVAHNLVPYVALKPLDLPKPSDTMQDIQPPASAKCQTPVDGGVGAMLESLTHKKAELQEMKDAITYHRSEAKKKDVAVDDLKGMVDGLKQTADELRDAAEAMRRRNRELEATIELMRSDNAAQENELRKVRHRAEVLQQEKAKALEGQTNLRRRLAKILWVHDPRDSSEKSKSAQSVSVEKHGPRNDGGAVVGTSVVSESEDGPGLSQIEHTTEQKTNELSDAEELKQKIERATEYSRDLEEKVRVTKQELENSLKREEALRQGNDTALKDQEDLKKKLAETTAAQAQLALSAQGPSDGEKDTPAESDGTELNAAHAREAKALEKVRQHKAHNIELKIARDVMRKKLLEVATSRVELETTLVETKESLVESQQALTESQKALAESRGSYATINKALTETDSSLSRCRTALIKSNQDLSKAQEHCHQLGSYAESWKTTCIAEREAGAHLLSRLTISGTAVKDAYRKSESPHLLSEANGALRQEAALHVNSAIYTMMAIINTEINRRVGAGQNKDWVGLQAIGLASTSYTGQASALSGPATAAQPVIQISSTTRLQQNGGEGR